MAISYVTSGAAAGTGNPIGSIQSGDLVVMAAIGLSATPTTSTSDWKVAYQQDLGTVRLTVVWQISAGTSVSMGSWSNGSGYMWSVYRDPETIGAVAGGNTSSATIQYSALTCLAQDTTSWIVRFGAALDVFANDGDQPYPTPVTDHTTRVATNIGYGSQTAELTVGVLDIGPTNSRTADNSTTTGTNAVDYAVASIEVKLTATGFRSYYITG